MNGKPDWVRVLSLAVAVGWTGCLWLPAAQQGEGEVKRDVVKEFTGKPAGKALGYFQCGLKDLTLVDDPPGKLQAITFTSQKSGRPRTVTLWLKYTPRLFSAERAWTIGAIRKALVWKVAIDRP